MDLYHLRDLIQSQTTAAKALECIDQVLLTYEACIINIKLLEKALEHLVCKRLLEGERGCKELGIVYFLVAYVVDLCNYTGDGLLVDAIDVSFSHGLCKLVSVDAPTPIKIYSLELKAELLELSSHLSSLVCVLILHQVSNEQVQGGLLHERAALVPAQLVYQVDANDPRIDLFLLLSVQASEEFML